MQPVPRHPYPSQANNFPLLKAVLTRGGISPRPLVPLCDPEMAPRARAAAVQIFANLATLHASPAQRIARIMARVLHHLLVGERKL